MDKLMKGFITSSINIFSVTSAFFSVIVMYFIYLYSATQTAPGWSLLHLAAKIYLVISLIIVGLFVLFVVLFVLASLAFWMGFMLKK